MPDNFDAFQRKAEPPEKFALSKEECSILDGLRQYGTLERAQLVDRLGFSRAKISQIVNELIDKGFIEDKGLGESSGGKRPKLLRISPTVGYLAGVDIGATSIDVALADFTAQIIGHVAVPANVRNGPVPVLSQVAELLMGLVEANHIPADQVVSMAIGVPGPVDSSTGLLISPPLMPGWDSFPIAEFFAEKFSSAKVIVDNDANLMALGELFAGVGQGVENFIFVKIGTGIGAGIVCKGKLYRGSSGCAGDVGHICVDWNGPRCHCGNVGCVATMAGGTAIAEKAVEAAKSGNSPFLNARLEKNGRLSAEDVSAAIAEGDLTAMEIICESGRLIGLMLASVVNFFNPKLIVIGGGVTKSGNHLLSNIRQTVIGRSLSLSTRHLRIEYSRLGDKAGVTGAIALAIENLNCAFLP